MKNWLDNARIAAIIGVVVVHSGVWLVTGAEFGTAAWWASVLSNEPFRWCVPLFVMVSGALLLDPSKDEPLQVFYRKRMSRILVPWIFWSLFYVGWTWGKGHVLHRPVSPETLLDFLVAGIPYPHMWYLYMVVPLYFFAPFLRRLVGTCTVGELSFLAFASWGLAAVAQYRISSSGVFPPFFYWFLLYIPFFLLGRVVDVRPPTRHKVSFAALMLVCTVSMAIGHEYGRTHHILSNGNYFLECLSVTSLGLSLGAIHLAKHWDRPLFGSANRTVSNLTFAIYLVHPVILDLFKMVLHPSPTPLFAALVPVVAVATFGLALGTGWVMARLPLLRRVI